MSASTIVKFGKLQERARKTKCKVEIVSGLGSENWKTYYAIGPTSVRNFQSHLENFKEQDDYDNCKVFTYETVKEVEAHLNAIEFCAKLYSP